MDCGHGYGPKSRQASRVLSHLFHLHILVQNPAFQTTVHSQISPSVIYGTRSIHGTEQAARRDGALKGTCLQKLPCQKHCLVVHIFDLHFGPAASCHGTLSVTSRTSRIVHSPWESHSKGACRVWSGFEEPSMATDFVIIGPKGCAGVRLGTVNEDPLATCTGY